MSDLEETKRSVQTILPGATIGIFGGGQLGRMTAMAARGMGYRIKVLDPDPASCTVCSGWVHRGGMG